MMNILISNDDGYFSEGIQALKKGLEKNGHQVFLVAPDRDNSACGMSITVRSPLTVRKISETEYAVNGSPVDCVVLALGGLIAEPIDIVVSGINNGANLSDDVFYSGTVAAALEARRLTNPSIAVSVVELQPKHYDTAVHVVEQLLTKIADLPEKEQLAFLNVNVPDVAAEELAGIKATHLGKRLPSEKHKTEVTAKGVTQCWIGPAGQFDRKATQQSDDSVLYDFACVEAGYASVTPVKAEWRHADYVDACSQWLD